MVIHYVHFCLLMSCGEMFADMEHLLVVPLPMTVVLKVSQDLLVVMVVLKFSQELLDLLVVMVML